MSHNIGILELNNATDKRTLPIHSVSGSMPLSMVERGEEVTITHIKGKDDTRRFLENLGFVVGTAISVVSELGGNVIISVKDTRIAVSKAMATRIMIERE